MSKEALVIERNILFKDETFQGFLPQTQRNLIPTILSNFKFHPRGEELETNKELQQIIPYVWILNPKTKQVFAYRRAPNENYTEKRLRNKWSCGVGGHIDKEDSEDPIANAMMRELQEEIKIAEYPTPKIVGYLNDDKDSVGLVHFGVVAIAETPHNAEKGDEEMAEGRMFSIPELEALFANPENDIEAWTQLSWPFVKSYLESLPNK
jgi:predicted NUDIX family phosphoesterase